MNENKAKIAGILSIVSGVFGILGFISLMFVVAIIGMSNGLFSSDAFLNGLNGFLEDQVIGLVQAMYIVTGIFSLILGVLGIIGGIFSIKRKAWGLALAGAIAGVFTFFPTGVAAIIYVAMGKNEFYSSKPQFSSPQP
jgi:hypothetical protein